MNRKIFVFGDLSQAESRIVAWRGPVPRLKKIFKDKKDVHLEVAKTIAKVVQDNKVKLPGNLFMKKAWNELTKEDKNERQLGKTTGHANNYGLGKDTFALRTGLPVQFAALIQAIYHSQFPEIRGGYQAWIRQQIDSSRCVTTALGRPKIFYDLVNDQMYRAAYAYYPQSTVGDIITDAIVNVSEHFSSVGFDEGIVWTPSRLRSCGLNFKINAHDALGVVVPDDKESVDYAVKTMRQYSEVKLNILGDDLVIPMDFKVGYSWGDLHDYEGSY